MLVLGLLGALGALGLGGNLVRYESKRFGFFKWGYFISSLVIYGLEVYLGLRLLQEPTCAATVAGLANWLFAIYLIGLGGAWQFLGERSLRLR